MLVFVQMLEETLHGVTSFSACVAFTFAYKIKFLSKLPYLSKAIFNIHQGLVLRLFAWCLFVVMSLPVYTTSEVTPPYFRFNTLCCFICVCLGVFCVVVRISLVIYSVFSNKTSVIKQYLGVL